MTGIVQVISSSIVEKYQIIKGYLFGKFPQSFKESAPYGIDSCPVNNTRAVYVSTQMKGKNYVIGYVTTERKTTDGELRLFSTSTSGTLSAECWFKNNGVIELNGNTDNAVRYIPLNTALQSEAAKINTNLSAILTNLTQLNVAVNALAPGSVTTPYIITTVDVNISSAKIDNIKTS